MKSSNLALACILALVITAPVLAEDAAPVAEGDAMEAAASAPQASSAPASDAAPAPHQVQLGPAGQDESGRPGRLHTVQRGDTLWDISDAYLGTPWVWPSIWTDNGTIENPHRIYPNDMIWITPHEMRKVSASEAEGLLAGGEMPASLDGMAGLEKPRIYTYSEIQSTGFVSVDELEGAAAVMNFPSPRTWFTDHDKIVIGLGEGETEVGRQYDILRTAERVADPATGILFGYHTEYLGWLEVTEVHPETSWAIVRLSRSELTFGDKIVPRRARSADIEVGPSPEVEGQIAFTPNRRFDMASTDVVYLNKGAQHGLEVGSPLEIFRPMGTSVDAVKDERLALPDHIIAKLLVVDVNDESAVAVVTHTLTELARGDHFRGTDDVNP